jgi:hypothetical protein
MFFLLSFSIDEKETKNLGKKMLPPASRKLSGFGRPAFLPTQRALLMKKSNNLKVDLFLFITKS